MNGVTNKLSDDEFLKNQSLDDFDITLDVNYPITLKDKIVELAKKICNYYNFFSYTCWDNELKQVVKHTFAVRLRAKRTGEFISCDVKEVRRDFETYPTIFRDLYYMDYGCARGCHVIWARKNNYWGTFEPSKIWEFLDTEYYHEKMAYYTFEINFAENIIAYDSSLKYMGYDKQQNNIDLLDYIKIYRKEPIVETFMKLKLFRFIKNEKAIKTTNENKAFRKWLYRNYEDCNGKAFITCFNSFKKNPNNSVQNYFDSLTYRIECGKELAKGGKEIYEYAIQFATRERIKEYLEDNNIGAISYFDYLTACRWLQLNFNDTKVLFPKDFKTYHDEYTKQYGDWKLEQEKKQAEKENIETEAGMINTASEFKYCNYQGKFFSVIVAKSKMELIEEGSQLHHCVGKMGYDKKQAKGESLICFVRKTNEIEKPLTTIQLDLKNFNIMQCYAIHNSTPDKDVMNFINNSWLPRIKKARKQLAINI